MGNEVWNVLYVLIKRAVWHSYARMSLWALKALECVSLISPFDVRYVCAVFSTGDIMKH